jgi:hypothetical protein
MSALCHKQTFTASLGHLAGAGGGSRRRLRLRRDLHLQFSRLRPGCMKQKTKGPGRSHASRGLKFGECKGLLCTQ